MLAAILSVGMAPSTRIPAGRTGGYTAGTEQAALDAFADFSTKWEGKYPAIVRLWTNAWAEMVPFLAFDGRVTAGRR